MIDLPLFNNVPPAKRFDGNETYSPELDCARLTGQLAAVYEATRDGRWHTLSHLARAAGASEASVSARLRDLRKPRFGAHQIERKRVDGGLYVYRRCPKV